MKAAKGNVGLWHICDMLSLSQLLRNTLQSGPAKHA